jgi:hypothetical protein
MNKPEDNPDMRVLKTATCKSTSGKSTLTYQIGCTSDSSIHIRITKNSGAGFFNDEWVAIKGIQKALAEGPKGQPLTSFLLHNLLSGRSTNSPAFLMAALCSERLLRVLKGKKRGHEFLDPEGFNARMQRLVNAPVKSKGTSRTTTKASTKNATANTPRKKATGTTKKAAIKKKAMSTRKTSTTG